MPLIDVTELLVDPDFCQTVTLLRRTQSIDSNGQGSVTTVTSQIIAVVTALSGDMVRQPEAEFTTNAIMVHTITPLQGVTATGLPDIIVWHGNNYIVKRSNDWSDFGRGFVSATCSLVDVVTT